MTAATYPPRCAARIAALLAALLLLGSPARADDARPRILLLGDSNVHGPLGAALAAELDASGWRVQRFGKPSSGLARLDWYDWISEARRQVSMFSADVVIFQIGGNDGQGLAPAPWETRPVAWRDAPRWSEVYGRRIDLLLSVLAGQGRIVFVLGPTHRRSPMARVKLARVAAVQRERSARDERVTWIDMAPLTTDERGAFLERGRDPAGRAVKLRHADGIHFTRAGGAVVALRVMDALRRGGLPL